MSIIRFKPSGRGGSRTGLTLVELVVVLVIMVALASIVIPRADTSAEQSRIDATIETLRRLRDVIVNSYVPDTNGAAFTGANFLGVVGDGTTSDGLPRNGSLAMPPQLVCLFLNPGLSAYNSATHFGWRGPYLTSGTAVYPGASPGTATLRGFLPSSSTTSVFGTAATAASGTVIAYPGDPTVLDAWGNPVVIVPVHDLSYNQYYYALLSAGPSGVLGPLVSAYNNATGLSAASGLLANAIPATISVDTTGLSGIAGVAPTGSRVLTISTTEYYPYWTPLQ
jgi:type II secretory pathway pseudopilin PulG